MRFFISILFLVSSATALSATHFSHAFEYFHGKGYYEMPDGQKGKFVASLMVKKHEDGKYSLRYSIHSHHHDMKLQIGLGKANDGSIFAITHEDKKIGYGYCVDSGVCHFNYSMDGVDVEETFKILQARKHKRGKHGNMHAVGEENKVPRHPHKDGKRMFFSMGSMSHDGVIKKSWVMSLKSLKFKASSHR